MSLAEKITVRFREIFNRQPLVYTSPGRINLIGEHTDYNNGYVFPAAIDKAVYIAISPSAEKTSRWVSVDFNEEAAFDLDNISSSTHHWANYILAVVQQFKKRGHHITAFDCVVAADLPVGAGMSSSAAFEACVAFALNELNGLNYGRLELAKICQRAENEFIGLQCGIMDMYASLFGKADHLIRLDCRSLEHEYFPFELKDYELVLLDTNVKHSLASSEYNTRRKQCEEGISVLKKYDTGVSSLRDVSRELLERYQGELSPLVFKRCMYVVEENERVLAGCEALLKHDLIYFGRLMYGSHNGLQNEYEVSCEELDFLVDAAKKNPDVAGARMMGGGFGGCTINLVKKGKAETWFNKLAPVYHGQFNKPLTHYEVKIGEGTRRISS